MAVLLLEIGVGGYPVNVVRQARAAVSADLYIGFLQSIDSLNPYIGINDASYLLYGLIYDYPYALDQDGNYIPNIVTSSSCANPSCSIWNYSVRQGVYWSDGTQLTAADVAFTFNYDSQNLFHLWAFEPYFNQVVVCTGGNKNTCGARITGTWNVTVYFQRPFAAGEDLFAPIVQQAQWSGVSPQAAETSYANANPIGTGPFTADANIYNEWLQNGQVPFHVFKNTRYHPVGTHTAPINITNIYLRVYQDPNSLALALQAGDIQLAQMPPSGIDLVKGQSGILVQQALQAIQEWNEIGISQIDTNAADGRLNIARFDANVRRAMAMATNKDYIVNNFYFGAGERGDTLISPITPQWWYDPVAGGDNLTFNIAAANALLAGSGWSGTWSDSTGTYRMNPSPITVSYQTACYQCVSPANVTKTIPAGTHLAFTLATRPVNQNPEEVATANYLAEQFKQIGVKITVKVETTEDALSTDVYGGYVEMYIWYWSADPDPNYILSMESSWTLDGWNDNYWNNATYNALYLKQMGDTNPTVRQTDVKAAEKLFYESAVYIIYVFPFGNWAMRTDVASGGQQWTGWGDWAAHPYRQMNAYWGANPLWFDLTCPTCSGAPPPNAPPTDPVITGSTYVGLRTNTTLGFTATSSDPETTDTLNWTWHWGDGNTTVTTGSAAPPAESTASHFWYWPGNYTVYVSVEDGWNPSNLSADVFVNVTSPPPPGTTGSISGTVRDTGGTALSGAQISVTPGHFTNSTRAAGTYLIENLTAGAYNVTVVKPGYASQTKSGVTVTVGATTTVDFSLAASIGYVVGTVTNSADNGPIQGVVIHATVASGPYFGHQNSTTTNAAGQYNFSLDTGMYWINASLQGWTSKSTAGVNVTTGQVTTVSFSLTSTAPPNQPQGLDPLIVGVIVLVVVIAVAAVVALLLMRRRKTKETEAGKIELPPKSP